MKKYLVLQEIYRNFLIFISLMLAIFIYRPSFACNLVEHEQTQAQIKNHVFPEDNQISRYNFSINDLPRDLVFETLDYLIQDLPDFKSLYALSLVNKKFNTLTQDSQLIKLTSRVFPHVPQQYIDNFKSCLSTQSLGHENISSMKLAGTLLKFFMNKQYEEFLFFEDKILREEHSLYFNEFNETELKTIEQEIKQSNTKYHNIRNYMRKEKILNDFNTRVIESCIQFRKHRMINHIQNLEFCFYLSNELTRITSEGINLIKVFAEEHNLPLDIDLANNNFSWIPDSFFSLENVTRLILSDNCLSYIPDAITKFASSLTSLKLENYQPFGKNSFSVIPDFIYKLHNLKELNMSSTGIREFTHKDLMSIRQNLNQINYIDLSYNKIISIPQLDDADYKLTINYRGNPTDKLNFIRGQSMGKFRYTLGVISQFTDIDPILVLSTLLTGTIAGGYKIISYYYF